MTLDVSSCCVVSDLRSSAMVFWLRGLGFATPATTVIGDADGRGILHQPPTLYLIFTTYETRRRTSQWLGEFTITPLIVLFLYETKKIELMSPNHITFTISYLIVI